MNSYIIPANSKKSMLILVFFKPVDLIIFITGVALTIILAIFIKATEAKNMLLILIPGCVAGLLVMPVPHYHNVRQLITNFLSFFSGRRKYIWKGWCWYGTEAIAKYK